MEAALVDNPKWQDDEGDEPSEIVNLRLAGSLSTMLRQPDVGTRIVDEEPFEACPDPVALYVCRQSRLHTLRKYQVVKALGGRFYYYPQRDVIHFSVDVADEYETYMPFLEQYHHKELNDIQTFMVIDDSWPQSLAEKTWGYTVNCISHLRSLRTIMVLWEDPKLASSVSGSSNDWSKEGPEALAERLKITSKIVLKNEKCTAKRIEVWTLTETCIDNMLFQFVSLYFRLGNGGVWPQRIYLKPQVGG